LHGTLREHLECYLITRQKVAAKKTVMLELWC
jgi:hypothetical protein